MSRCKTFGRLSTPRWIGSEIDDKDSCRRLEVVEAIKGEITIEERVLCVEYTIEYRLEHSRARLPSIDSAGVGRETQFRVWSQLNPNYNRPQTSKCPICTQPIFLNNIQGYFSISYGIGISHAFIESDL